MVLHILQNLYDPLFLGAGFSLFALPPRTCPKDPGKKLHEHGFQAGIAVAVILHALLNHFLHQRFHWIAGRTLHV